MTLLQAILYILLAVVGTATVANREPKNQALVLSLYGLLLTLLFVTLQAPDVALSEMAVGSAGVPLMLLATLARVRRIKKEEK
jgi:uncharacterized MnhB-related membrane protein